MDRAVRGTRTRLMTQLAAFRLSHTYSQYKCRIGEDLTNDK